MLPISKGWIAYLEVDLFKATEEQVSWIICIWFFGLLLFMKITKCPLSDASYTNFKSSYPLH